MKYDLVIIGGGTSGISCAYIASKLGLKTLLVEKSDVLGGSITQGLVIPVMKVDSKSTNIDFYNELVKETSKSNVQATYGDNNSGWFNPELLKITFDKLLKSVNCHILFNTIPINCIFHENNKSFEIDLKHNLLSLHIETDYIVDASANGEIFNILNYKFQEKKEISQATSLRFIMSGVDTKTFADWVLNLDKDRTVTTAYKVDGNIMLSTACTWDKSKNWALTPIFEEALRNNDLEYEDTAYFQVFSVPKAPNSIAFNAPRILLDDDEDLSDPFVYSRALIQGRERILRLSNFCKKYLKGFENSYISHISDTLGVRESYRIKGKYTFTKDDIINPKTFKNIAFSCDYPIDIHSNKKDNDKLEYVKQKYNVPIECLISENNEKLYGIGRIISAVFESQAALRTQMSCFSMGEAAAKDIYTKIKN
jgi:hypothetical protein